MIDSGATALFIHDRFVNQHKIWRIPLKRPIPLSNIDGTKNKAGSLTHYARLTLKIGDHEETSDFLITDIGPEDVILGLPWLKKTNPVIDWNLGQMVLQSGLNSEVPPSVSQFKMTRAERRHWLKTGIIEDNTDEVWCMASMTYSTQLAAEVNEKKYGKPLEDLIPAEYLSHRKVFSEEESHCLPKHQLWDHTIDLKPDAPAQLKFKVYPMPVNKQKVLEEFIKENLEKGYIVPSKSPMASPVFFVKKKDGKLRLIQDYRKLNAITILNRYPLPLATDIINKLKRAKIFTKFDVRWGYHNIRIKEGDEWKAAFVTNQGLFEPKVMFFGLTNSPATFQALMNSIFADLIAEGKVAVYLDDILIWSDNLRSHRKIVHEVLKRLEEHDLYLRPEKCEFEKEEIEYLGLIIRHNEVAMDPIKVRAVTEWPTPKNLKEVRAFVGFANFYRRFIKDFSKIARPLHDLTKKDTAFIFGPAQLSAFETLKAAFTSDPILAMWSAERETRLEVDASGYATGGVISQKGEDGLWHPIAYRSASMTEAERNYEIYDREMLAFCEALKDWRHFLEGLDSPFEVWTDHANLQYWRTAQHLTRRQARWALLLADFNFVLVHKAGTANTRADPLSRMPQHQVGDAEDNNEEIVLKPEYFKIAATAALTDSADIEKRIRESTALDEEVTKALDTLKSKGPRKLTNGTLEWENVNGLLYYKGKLYIPDDSDLRSEIVKSCHDAPAAGHPGRNATLELVSRNYWWPRMGPFIERYVLGCDQCQRMKPAAHPRPVLHPQPVPDGPWQFIGVDLITQLPKSRGFDSIAVYVDHYSDQCHLIPCTTKITAEGIADLHYREIFRLHGVPRKIVSDRGPQFAARFMQALYKRLGITHGLTTAYHPQGNGKVERKNQEVESYLRLFCHKTQDDWVDHIPAAEFALNSRVSAATGHSPFEVIYGYCPDFAKVVGQRTNVPTLEARLDRMMEIRKEAEAALRLSKEKMVETSKDSGRLVPHEFQVGDLVRLSSKNIKIHQKTPKLGPRQLGPFKVLARVGDLDYKLELPSWLKIHDVIHVERLSPWRDNGLDPPPPPEPVVVDGEEEYEIEEILDSRVYRRQFQYLVKWKGFPGEDSWEPHFNVTHASEAVEKFHAEHPGAPRVIKASLFASLLPSLRPPENYTDISDSDYPHADLSWEHGKYSVDSASRGRSVLGGG